MPATHPSYPRRDAAYYQRFHDEDPGYQTNNWLLEELDSLHAFAASSVLELACGNGRFLEAASGRFARVFGCDWAVSPRIQGVLEAHGNVAFAQVDLYESLPPFQADLVASADFLEHLAPETLPEVVRRIDGLSAKAFHKIACYDDGHSHLSILSPEAWLALFQAADPAYTLERVECRLGDPQRLIAVFTKGRPDPRLESADPASVVGAAESLRLHFGCGDCRREGFLGVDIRSCAGADFCFPAWETGPFQPESVEEIYSRHMLEHLDPEDAHRTLVSWHRLLRPAGRLRLVVPDLRFHALQLLGQATSWDADAVRNQAHAMAGFYGWHDPGRGGKDLDAHRWGYTWESLSALLGAIGFEDVVRADHGEDTEPWHLHVTARKGV